MRPAAALASLLCVTSLGGAQDLRASLSGCHALKGARVLVRPGETLEEATVVVRDGRVVAVGSGVPVPKDAEVIEAGGLTVTAGFLLGGAEIAPGKETPAPDGGAAASTVFPPLPARAGVTPAVRAADLLATGEFKGAPWLTQGVTAVILSPKGRIVPGQAALVSTADGPVSKRVLKDRVAMVAGFRTAAVGYPDSLMGATALLRQLFLDAMHHETLAERFRRTPEAAGPPPFDPDLRAVADAVEGGRRPVLFIADRVGDVARAQMLAREGGFLLWVAGGLPVARAAEKLHHAVAVLDLTLPEVKHEANAKWLKELLAPPPAAPAAPEPAPPAAGPPAAEADGKPGGLADAGTGTPAPDGTGSPAPSPAPPPKDAPPAAASAQEAVDPYVLDRRRELAARERKDLEAVVEAGAALDAAKVTFLFAASKPETVLEGVRRQVAAGLDQLLALEALTTRPAALLGFEKTLGRVQAGYAADFVVFKGDPFRDGKVVHVFCRGLRHDLPVEKEEKKDKKDSPAAAEEVALAGTWTVEVEGRSEPSTLTIEKQGSSFGGSLASRLGEVKLSSVAVAGSEVTIQASLTLEEQTVEIRLQGKLNPTVDTITGTLKFGSSAERALTAKKKPGGDR